MSEFASMLDSMYSSTPVALADVKTPEEQPKGINTMMYIGLGLVAIALLYIVFVKNAKREELVIRQIAQVPKRVELFADTPAFVRADVANSEEPREMRSFKVVGDIPTTSEDDDDVTDQKISADKADPTIQKYLESRSLE
jgi:hypothetical protein